MSTSKRYLVIDEKKVDDFAVYSTMNSALNSALSLDNPMVVELEADDYSLIGLDLARPFGGCLEYGAPINYLDRMIARGQMPDECCATGYFLVAARAAT